MIKTSYLEICNFNQDSFFMSKNLGTHGGARKGAGRKKTGIETIVKRIPVIIEARVNEMIEALSDEIPRSTCLPLDAMPIDASHSDISIPLGVERIPAGFPSPAQSYIEDTLNFNEYLISNPSATFAVRSGGLSMLDAGINKDDILVIDRSVPFKHGDIVMADLGNEFTIKRLVKTKAGFELHSENASGEYPNFIPKEGDTWSIVGVVTFVLKDVRTGK